MKSIQLLTLLASVLLLSSIICDKVDDFQLTPEEKAAEEKKLSGLSDDYAKALESGNLNDALNIDYDEMAEEDEIIFKHVSKKYFKDKNKVWTAEALVVPALKFFAAVDMKEETRL